MINLALKLNINNFYLLYNNKRLNSCIFYNNIPFNVYIINKYLKYLLYYNNKNSYFYKDYAPCFFFLINNQMLKSPTSFFNNYRYSVNAKPYIIISIFKYTAISLYFNNSSFFQMSDFKHTFKITLKNFRKLSIRRSLRLFNMLNKNFNYFLKTHQSPAFFFNSFLNFLFIYNVYTITMQKYLNLKNMNTLACTQFFIYNYIITHLYFKNKYYKLHASDISFSSDFILFNDNVYINSIKTPVVRYLVDNFINKHIYLFNSIDYPTFNYSNNINFISIYKKNYFSNYNYKMFNIYLNNTTNDIFTQKLSINLFYDSTLLVLYFQQLANNLVNIIFNSYRILFETGIQPYIYTTSLSRKKFNYLSKFAFFDLYRIIVCVFKANDINLLKTWIINAFSQLHFKQHKFLCYMLRFYIRKMFAIFKRYSPCIGIYIRFKGKISVGGNARKRTFTIKTGTYSLTSKRRKLEYLQFYLLTQTGILGVKLMFSYQ